MSEYFSGPELAKIAIEIIENNGGSIGRSALLEAMKQKIPEQKHQVKVPDGRVAWIVHLDVYTSPSILGRDVIRKEGRVWQMVDGGKGRMKSLPPEIPEKDGAVSEPTQDELGDRIANHIKKVQGLNDGKKLEEISAALLRGMGYRHVEIRGGPGDGGVDIVAYKDKLGATPPRVKVQAKHWTTQNIPADNIRILESNLHEGEIGVFITTSSFTRDAKKHADSSGKHLFLVDLDRLVNLWVEHYPYMSEEDKKLVPLKYALDIEKVKDAPESDSD